MNLQKFDFEQSVQWMNHLIDNETAAVREAYGRFAHAIPHLIETNGLLATIGFVREQMPTNHNPSSRERAAEFILDRIARILDLSVGQLHATMAKAQNLRTAFLTDRLLAAWRYESRFVDALLGINSDMKES